MPHEFRQPATRKWYIKFLVKQLGHSIDGIDADTIVDDLEVFLYQCKKSKLDPLLGHIYGKYDHDGKFFTIVSIHAARLIAERTGRYAGSSDVTYTYNEDGIGIKRASIEIYKVIHEEKIVKTLATANFESYAPRDGEDNLTGYWAKNERFMIGKCVENLGLRKAFPSELGNLYVIEELDQHFASKDELKKSKGKLSDKVKANNKTLYNEKLQGLRTKCKEIEKRKGSKK